MYITIEMYIPLFYTVYYIILLYTAYYCDYYSITSTMFMINSTLLNHL